MAILQNPITGASSGQYGPCIFYVRDGKFIMRTKPLKVNDAKSPKQLIWRARFLVSLHYLRPLLYMIRISWNVEAIKQSAFNAVMSHTIKNSTILVNDEWVLNPPALLHAKGSLLGADDLVVTNPSAQNIEYTWSDNSGTYNASPDDTFCYVCFNVTKNIASSALTSQKRSDQSCILSLHSDWSGDEVAFYGFFKRANNSIVSDDTYLTTLNLL